MNLYKQTYIIFLLILFVSFLRDYKLIRIICYNFSENSSPVIDLYVDEIQVSTFVCRKQTAPAYNFYFPSFIGKHEMMIISKNPTDTVIYDFDLFFDSKIFIELETIHDTLLVSMQKSVLW